MQDQVNYGRQDFQQSEQQSNQYNQHPTIDVNIGLDMSQKEKEKRIKKLTSINKQLIETLKKQNDELSDKISRRKLKPKFKGNGKLNKSTTEGDVKVKKEYQSVKKELQNAYRQIDMYQKEIKKHRGKSVSIDAIDKINGLQNQVRQQDKAIENLQRQLRILQHTRKQQDQEINVYDNEENKRQLQILMVQAKNFKQKIKAAKKVSLKRQDLEKKQQSYQCQLQLALRKVNDEYYPGKKTEKQKTVEMAEDVPQRQWQILINRLHELKKSHQENTKKITNLTRQKAKQDKLCKQHEDQYKQKAKKLNALKSKVHELTKLATVSKKHQSLKSSKLGNSEQLRTDQGSKLPKINPKKNSFVGSQDDRDLKKWSLAESQTIQKGKVGENSVYFSDKALISDLKGVKVYAVHIWSDRNNTPWIIQFYYTDEKNRMIPGNQPISHIPSHLQHQVFQLGQGDFLASVEGVIDSNLIVGLTFRSRLGRQRSFLDEQQSFSTAEKFNFETKNGHIPVNFFGAYQKQGNQIRLCQIGCQYRSID